MVGALRGLMLRALAYFIAVLGLVVGLLAPAHAEKRVALIT